LEVGRLEVGRLEVGRLDVARFWRLEGFGAWMLKVGARGPELLPLGWKVGGWKVGGWKVGRLEGWKVGSWSKGYDHNRSGLSITLVRDPSKGMPYNHTALATQGNSLELLPLGRRLEVGARGDSSGLLPWLEVRGGGWRLEVGGWRLERPSRAAAAESILEYYHIVNASQQHSTQHTGRCKQRCTLPFGIRNQLKVQ